MYAASITDQDCDGHTQIREQHEPTGHFGPITDNIRGPDSGNNSSPNCGRPTTQGGGMEPRYIYGQAKKQKKNPSHDHDHQYAYRSKDLVYTLWLHDGTTSGFHLSQTASRLDPNEPNESGGGPRCSVQYRKSGGSSPPRPRAPGGRIGARETAAIRVDGSFLTPGSLAVEWIVADRRRDDPTATRWCRLFVPWPSTGLAHWRRVSIGREARPFDQGGRGRRDGPVEGPFGARRG